MSNAPPETGAAAKSTFRENTMRRLFGIVLPLLCVVPLVANALPQRTFVASNGADTNSCALTAPCRSFGTAVAAVAGGGEVIVLDSAGYGAATIAKSVSIISPPGIYAGVSVLSGSGIVIDAAAIKVVLRGLSINNQGGTNGILFSQGASLRVDGCVISGFSAGAGIDVAADSSIIHVDDTLIRDGGQGIRFFANVVATISRTRIEDNTTDGILILGKDVVSIEDSVVTGSDINVYAFPVFMNSLAAVTIARTLISGGSLGVRAEPAATGAAAIVSIMDSTISSTAAHGGINGGIYVDVINGNEALVLATRNQFLDNNNAVYATGAAAYVILDDNAFTGNFLSTVRNSAAVFYTRNNNTEARNANPPQGLPYTSLTGF
jgi:hypothetical protein